MSGCYIEMSDLDSEQKPSRRLWILAALAALALHVGGGALAVAHLRTNEPAESLGAPAIEIGLELISPHLEVTDLPPGQDTDASVASPALAEQKAEFKQTELPKDVPTEADDPDRVVARNVSNKPKENDPKIAAVQTSASTESAAQQATAKQSVNDVPEAETLTAPNIAIGKDRQKLAADWGRQISAYFEMHKRYPRVQRARSAKVRLNLEINRLGRVLSVGVAESSGDARFDEAAIAMIRRSDPVPRPPAKLTDDVFRYSLDVNFNERK